MHQVTPELAATVTDKIARRSRRRWRPCSLACLIRLLASVTPRLENCSTGDCSLGSTISTQINQYVAFGKAQLAIYRGCTTATFLIRLRLEVRFIASRFCSRDSVMVRQLISWDCPNLLRIRPYPCHGASFGPPFG
jgi:hypothetical protein